MTSEKKLEVPIKDFDDDSYDEVVEVKVEEVSKRPELNLEEADAKDLLFYFQTRFKEVHGYEYIISWVKEIGILRSFKERYGKDAGPMIDLLFTKYKGEINGGIMTITAFSKGSKWIQDKLYIELQQSRVVVETVKVEGLMDSDDFLRRIFLG